LRLISKKGNGTFFLLWFECGNGQNTRHDGPPTVLLNKIFI
jgi:hypothetical protein